MKTPDFEFELSEEALRLARTPKISAKQAAKAADAMVRTLTPSDEDLLFHSTPIVISEKGESPEATAMKEAQAAAEQSPHRAVIADVNAWREEKKKSKRANPFRKARASA